MRPFPTLPLALLALLALPTVAQAPAPADDPLPGIYVGKSQILDAAPPRQLSLNAHVKEWQYQPGGLAIAYVGSQFEDGTLKQFIKLAGVKRGQTTTLYSTSLNVDAAMAKLMQQARQEAAAQGRSPQQIADDEARARADLAQHPEMREWQARAMAEKLSLEGWSADGRYLLAQADATVRLEMTTPQDENPLICIDVAADPPRVRRIALPDAGTNARPMGTTTFWSPGHTRVAFERLLMSDKLDHQRQFSLYDPPSDKTYPVNVGDGLHVNGWLDENHLLLIRQTAGKRTWISHDVTTGKEVEIPRPNKLNVGDETPEPNGLTLETEPHKIVKADKTSLVESFALWVRRTSGPKALSAIPVGLTPGSEEPQAAWSPKKNQVAFIAHGDLFVTDLLTRPATVEEKYAAGEKLPCPEERNLAMSNLKQIGLGIMMYTQDYDENFPMADGRVNEAVGPYIKNPRIYGFGPNKFVYKAPAKLGLAAMDAPAETVLGTYDTRCAFIKLYADGHVKAFPKPGFENTFDKETPQ